MSKRQTSKYKINRRLGVNLWGRPKSPINKRSYGPGEHGQARRRKPSDFGIQLAAKQKLKGYYGNITERQFKRYYEDASRRKGDTGENLVEILERRLDAVVYRMKFVPTVFAARQFVNHGHVLVNGTRVTIPSYLVKDGDVVEVRHSRLRRCRLQQAEGHLRARAQARRRALSGGDGAEPRDRVLFAVISRRETEPMRAASVGSGPFHIRPAQGGGSG